jgi:hypothetical protein
MTSGLDEMAACTECWLGEVIVKTTTFVAFALLAVAVPASAQDKPGVPGTGTPSNPAMGKALPCALVYRAAFHGFPSTSSLDILNNTGATIPPKSVIIVTKIPGTADARYEIDIPVSPDQGYVRLLGLSTQPWAADSCSAVLLLP